MSVDNYPAELYGFPEHRVAYLEWLRHTTKPVILPSNDGKQEVPEDARALLLQRQRDLYQ